MKLTRVEGIACHVGHVLVPDILSLLLHAALARGQVASANPKSFLNIDHGLFFKPARPPRRTLRSRGYAARGTVSARGEAAACR